MQNLAPAIIVITYNRDKSLNRLLTSIYNANYDGYNDIPLIISIDGGGSTEILKIAKEFNWKYGEKRIIAHEENLGLRKHVISCGDLTIEYESAIVLEDDLFVSPYFYDYAAKSALFYYGEDKVAGISLYSYKYNEFAGLPFIPLQNGYDTFFMQVPSSWGQIWTKKQWKGFKQFYESNPVITDNDKLPDSVKKWSESSWKKFFFLYILKNNLYFVYPYVSYSTNFGDMGTHYSNKTSIVQVALTNTCKNNVFPKIQETKIIYDIYMELLPKYFWDMGIMQNVDFCVDMYGSKQLDLFENEFCFSIKECVFPIKQYGIDLIPIENNIIFEIPGNMLFFAKRTNYKNNISVYDKICKVYDEATYNMGYRNGNSKYSFAKKLLRFIAAIFSISIKKQGK